MILVDAPPTDFSVENLKAHGLMVALKWPYGKDLFGWEIGNFLRICPERKKGRLQKHRGCYEILFEEDGAEYFWPKRPTSDYGCERWWVLIKELSSRIIQSPLFTRLGALRCASAAISPAWVCSPTARCKTPRSALLAQFKTPGFALFQTETLGWWS